MPRVEERVNNIGNRVGAAESGKQMNDEFQGRHELEKKLGGLTGIWK